MNRFYDKCILLFATSFLIILNNAQAANRYWVFKNFYDNDFSSSAKLTDWQLIEDDGTGGFALSGHGTGILTMDDAAGGYANRLFNINGGSPRFVPLDAANGQVELDVLSTTGGNQLFFLQVQEFDASNNYLGQLDILAPQNTTGFFAVSLSSFTWDPAAVSIRFIIGGENFSGLQGTIEFGYFSYSTGNNHWYNPANWSASSNGPGGASVPLSSDIAIFDGAGNNNGGCNMDADVTINGLAITNGYLNNLDMQGFSMTIGFAGADIAGGGVSEETNSIVDNGNLTITGGDFTNISGTCFVGGDIQILGGILSPSSNFVLSVNGSADQSIQLGAGMALDEIIVNKSGGNLNLSSNLDAYNMLTLIQGNINTNGFNLILGYSAAVPGTLTYTSGNVKGIFKRWISASTTGTLLFPMGNTAATAPFSINIISASGSGGSISVQYNDASPGFTASNFPDNATTIVAISTASWTVTGNGLSGGNFSLSASDDHVSGIADYTALHMTLSNGVVGTHVAAAGSNMNPTVKRSGIDATTLDQTFFIGAGSTALPVKLISFTATERANTVEWKWSVSEEENLNYYEPEYSTDAIQFIPAGEIKATNLLSLQTYSFDKEISASPHIYCRIKSVDADGKYYYSQIILINNFTAADLVIWPNPAKNELYIQDADMLSGPTSIQVISMSGTIYLNKIIPASSGSQIEIQNLPDGVYHLKVSSLSGKRVRIKSFIHIN